jgi:signal transduction histidine kinase/PAS domain-containing protein
VKISWLEKLRRDFSETVSLPELLDAAVRGLQLRARAQRVEIVIAQGEASVRRYTHGAGSASGAGSTASGAAQQLVAPPLTFNSKGVFLDGNEIKGAGIIHSSPAGGAVRDDDEEERKAGQLAAHWLASNGQASLLLVPLYLRGKVSGYICAQWTKPYHMNQTITEAQSVATMVSLESARFIRVVSHQPSIRRDFERLIDVGQLVVMRTDAKFVVNELIGNTETLLGVPRESLVHDPLIWKKLFNEADLRLVRDKLRKLNLAEELREEVRLVNQRSGAPKWLMVRGVALRGEGGALVGWELYGVDITDKHLADEDLRRERERLSALFEVSQAVQSLLAPELVCSRGVGALAKSTNADAAFAAVVNAETGRVELVALNGFLESQFHELEGALQRRSLVRLVLEHNEGLVVTNIPQDPRVAATAVMAGAGLLSAVLAPIRDESGVAIGALALFSRETGRWTLEEQKVLEAAGLLISSALHRSLELESQRVSAEQYQVLYALNHELARLVTVSEIGAHALAVASKVVPSRNAWFALVAPSGDSLVGQSGLGPQMTREMIDSRIALNELATKPLADWIKRRQISILSLPSEDPAAQELASTLPILAQLGGATYVAVPLVTLNQVIGVLLLEPTLPVRVIERRLGLLQSLASEVGAVVFARRLESKMGEADKMRVTGHLAAGVAHNFNNILQGILGHASLLHSQLAPGSTLRASAEQILQSANRGGQLIKQLSGLAQIQGSVRKAFDVGGFLGESKELWSSALGSRISLVCDIKRQLPSIYADEGLIQQVMMNLLVNAREAIGGRSDGVVRVTAEVVTVKAGELKAGSRAGKYVRVSVADNGVGMAQDLIERCFEPFFSTKGVDPRSGLSLSGAGLGLSSAYAIVREHDGYLDVRSSVGRGSTFVVLIPALTLNESVTTDSPAKSADSGALKVEAGIETASRESDAVSGDGKYARR